MNFKNKTREILPIEMMIIFSSILELSNLRTTNFNARIENLFDDNYEEVIGYQHIEQFIWFTYNF